MKKALALVLFVTALIGLEGYFSPSPITGVVLVFVFWGGIGVGAILRMIQEGA